jgi:CTP:molybdopterin cytidylyltransferase MocA
MMPEPIPIIIGASHNIDERPQEEVDEELRATALKYRERGQMASYKFQRVRVNSDEARALGIDDENKFTMPVHDTLTCTDILTTRFATEYDTRIAVVGNDVVGRQTTDIVRSLRAYGNATSVRQVPEEDTPRLSQTVRAGWEALGRPDKYIFIAGDIPLADIDSIVLAYHQMNPAAHGIMLDMNARERVFKNGPPLFDRNYHATLFHLSIVGAMLSKARAWRFRATSQSESPMPEIKSGMYRYKEPNTFVYSDRFQQFALLDEVYRKRTKGELSTVHGIARTAYRIAQIRGVHPSRLLLNRHLPRTILEAVPTAIFSARYLRFVPTLGMMQSLASAIVGEPVRVSIDHTDPLRVKDDDALHDHAYYQGVFDRLCGTSPFHGLDRIMPMDTVRVLSDLSRERAAHIEEYPMIKNFNQYVELRSRQLGIREYFTPDGQFQFTTREDEKLDETIAHLEHRLRGEPR